MNLFPFSEIREEQDDLVEDVKEAVEEGGNLIAHAPSGLGKTVASISPSIEYAIEEDKTVFFLTPKHSQHKIAVETVEKIMDKNSVEISIADIIGKRWLCNVDGIEDMSSADFQNYCATVKKEERCSYYNKVFNDSRGLSEKAKEKLKEMKNKAWHAEEIKKNIDSLCPYEILINHAKDSDVIIGDYFHIFHPKVREAFLGKTGKDIEDSILIVDEAHNLPPRTRNLLSRKLSTYQVSRAQKEADEFGYLEERRILEEIENVLSKIGKGMEGEEEKITKEEFKDRVEDIGDYKNIIERMERVARDVYEEKDRSYCSSVRDFLEAWLGKDRGFVRFIRRRKSKSGNVYYSCHYECLNPQLSTSEPFQEAYSSILMSATLTPMQMYSDLLGLETGRTSRKVYESPFPKKNREFFVVDSVTTKYKERDEDQFKKIGWIISKSMEKVPGNASAFFPSYKLRNRVKETIDTEKDIMLEKRGLSKEDKSKMLNHLSKVSNSLLLGVSGASFSEGVDFPEGSMDAVFVVGLPLKEPDLETRALIDFYEYKFGKGWDYAYAYPAMKKALQAAGRCIRTKRDRGIVFFMDERYLWKNYRKVFPPEIGIETTKAPWTNIENFFESSKK